MNLLLPNIFSLAPSCFYQLLMPPINKHLNCFQGFCECSCPFILFLNLVTDLCVCVCIFLGETIYKFLEVKLLVKRIDFENGQILTNCPKEDSSNYYPIKSV